jgi:hypothetical protein
MVMKKLLLIFLILFCWKWASAQELILEKNPEEILIFAGDSQFYLRETWIVQLQSGENIYSWEKPNALSDDEIFIQVEGGILNSILSPSSERGSTVTILADSSTEGRIHFTYSLSSLTLNYLYQYYWEKEKATPSGFLLADITNQGQEAIRNANFVIAGREFTLQLEPYETKRLKVQEFQVITAEKVSRYDPFNYGDTDVHFFWKLAVPTHILFPAKAEYFEKSTSGVVFLGENFLSGTSPDLEMEVGKSNDLTVEEKILKQDKFNQVYNNKGQVVLYDTQEKKLYTVANRGTEVKKIEVFVPLQPSFEMISHSVLLDRIESNRLIFTLELQPQQKVEVVLEVEGKNLTSGFVF